MQNELLSLLKDARLHHQSTPIPLDYLKLYQLSVEHQIVPLIYNQIYSFLDFPLNIKEHWKKEALKINAFQTMKTDRFLRIYQKFLDKKLVVIVVKGIILRSLYPQPDNRQSNDEDLYIQKDYLQEATDILLNEDLMITSQSDDVTTFIDPLCGLSIELHTALFSKESKAYGQYQNAFDHAFDNIIEHDIQGVQVYSLSYDLHILFLIMHFVKHFLHGGVGIHQIVDIVMYSEAYGHMIHWNEIYETLEELNVLILMMNVFALAHDYLDFDYDKIVLPDSFEFSYDYESLLDDIIDAGIFGKSSEERLHSSTITLNAIEKGKTTIIRSIFPTLNEMKGKYEYLHKKPYLLPIAYITRIYHYLLHNDKTKGQKTIEIGNKRVELLKKYKVIS